LRVAFSSCSGKSGYDAAKSWRAIQQLSDIDLILLLGDNHYADTTDPAIISKHYASHRGILAYRDVTATIPTYGIWDDHDFGPNNSDGQTPGKEKSLAIFKKHWPNPEFGEPDNPGIYFTFRRGDVQFILLDSRYHRTPNTSMKADDPRKVLLGEKQLTWLEETLKQSTAKMKIVACGSEFQRHGSSDGFSGFRTEQAKVLDLMKSTEGVLLISGDRHFTAGYQVRGETIEVTSGPLGSGSARSRPSSDRFYGNNSGKMFSVFDIATNGERPTVTWQVHLTGKGLVHEQTFSWQQINGKEQLPRQ
jgi:alkaline phosphatase D